MNIHGSEAYIIIDERVSNNNINNSNMVPFIFRSTYDMYKFCLEGIKLFEKISMSI